MPVSRPRRPRKSLRTGQVTIPQELRARYGLEPLTEVEIVPGEDGALVRPVTESTRGARFVAKLRDRADGGLSADAVLALTRGDSGPSTLVDSSVLLDVLAPSAWRE